MAGAGRGVAAGESDRAAAPGPAAGDQRDPVAGPDRRALARRSGAVRAWETAYCLFRTWQRDGTWTQVLTRLQARADAKGLITWDVSVDSTVAIAATSLTIAADRIARATAWRQIAQERRLNLAQRQQLSGSAKTRRL